MPHSDLELALFYYDLGRLEIDSLRRGKIRLVILHQYAETTSPERSGRCTPGEEVISAFIVHRGQSYRLDLSTTHLILLDYLCRHRAVAQSAAQIIPCRR